MDESNVVNGENSDEQLTLREQVEDSEQAMQGLERDLQNIDSELGQLAAQDRQFDVLSQVCRSLEELDDLGAAELFWQGRDTNPADYIQEARDRIHNYGESLLQVEQRRNAIVDKIGDQNVTLDCLHYDLVDVLERDERRQNEWVVERDVEEYPAHAQVMPWVRGCEEDERYRKSLATSLLTALLLGILVSSIAIPISERSKELELPERMAKLVREQLPPPPAVPVEEPQIDEDIPEPEPELADEQPPEIVQEADDQPQVAAADEPDIKEQVKSKGILAFRDSFASNASYQPSTQLGADARVRSAGENAVGRPQRAMVTSNAPGSSGGINLANISRDVGGGGPGMGGVAVSRVASSIGSGGNGFSDRPLAGGAMAGRTDEEIQIVFDRYKAALYRLYNRELRKDPTLRGQIIIKLTIEPDGSVSFCTLQSTDMNATTLTEQVVGRVSTFDFGAKEDISAVTIIYPIDFLPAA
jgi:outer membrane biosynthesis protein TonB